MRSRVDDRRSTRSHAACWITCIRSIRWSATALLALAVISAVLAAACTTHLPTSPGDTADPPPLHQQDGSADVNGRRAAAVLLVEPREIARGGHATIRVDNRGELRLGYGRPITVERWDGQSWVETEESRQAAWTMELLIVAPGQQGEAQRWPFLPGREAEPGWYRFSKQVFAESGSETAQFIVRASVRVVGR